MTPSDLITRLSEADGPSLELDAEIDELINPGPKSLYTPPRFTSSLDAALTLVERGDHWGISKVQDERSPMRYFGTNDKLYFAECGNYGFPKEARHNHPAIALCLAALKARSYQEREG